MTPEQLQEFNKMKQDIAELKNTAARLNDYSTLPIEFQKALEFRFKLKNQPIFASKTIDFANINAGSTANSTIRVSGAKIGDIVILGIPHANVGSYGRLLFKAWVSAQDTVSIDAINTESVSAIDADSGEFTVAVFPK